ncbi:hypothetical protein UT300019_22290 [Clostridium sp. CTA-19]
MATLLYFSIDAFVDFNFSPMVLEVGPKHVNKQLPLALAPSQMGQAR